MDWKSLYQQKCCTADEAVQHIKSGDRVVVTHAAGEPVILTDALVRNAGAYRDVEIVHMISMGKSGYCAPELYGNFCHNSLFVGGTTRKAVSEGRGDYTPLFYYQTPEMFQTSMPVDVTLLQLSPPDRHGYCSCGVSVDYTLPAARYGKMNIAQINKHMPRTLGDTFLHVSELDYIVEADTPVIELPPPELTEIEQAIGRNIAKLVWDGDTLQLGIGAIPDAALRFLGDKKDLGIHSEMISDGVLDLIEKGVITNRRKTIHTGKTVITFLMGTRRLYDFVDNNPTVELYPVDYVNDPRVICQNDNMVSINSCVEVDLMGQVVSDCIGQTQISGIGGQVDYVRGATMSKGGRSIIAIHSTAARGKVSKIVPFINHGAAVTTSRCDVDYVVTEYGIAHLRHKTLRARAQALIAIAHPDHRGALQEEYDRRYPAIGQ